MEKGESRKSKGEKAIHSPLQKGERKPNSTRKLFGLRWPQLFLEFLCWLRECGAYPRGGDSFGEEIRQQLPLAAAARKTTHFLFPSPPPPPPQKKKTKINQLPRSRGLAPPPTLCTPLLTLSPGSGSC